MNDKEVKSNLDLADIRSHIDTIDQSLLELLAKRADLVKEVVQTKRSSGDARILRPAREAQQFRKFIEWHRSTGSVIPRAGFLAVWREIISASVSQQKPLEVHYPSTRPAFSNMARVHFGQAASYIEHETVDEAYAAMALDAQSIAVLPLEGSWWKSLPEDITLFARLPLYALNDTDTDVMQAVCVGRVGLEPSGDDVSLLVGPAQALPEGAEVLASSDSICLVAVEGYILPEQNKAGEGVTGDSIFDSYSLKGVYARIRL